MADCPHPATPNGLPPLSLGHSSSGGQARPGRAGDAYPILLPDCSRAGIIGAEQ